MSRTRRNDMGYEIVRDGKAFRAKDERLDPWNKEYYHAKGMKKRRYQETQFEIDFYLYIVSEWEYSELNEDERKTYGGCDYCCGYTSLILPFKYFEDDYNEYLEWIQSKIPLPTIPTLREISQRKLRQMIEMKIIAWQTWSITKEVFGNDYLEKRYKR